MHLLSRDLWTEDFCGNTFSLFLEILASLKLVNYTQLHVILPIRPFDALANGKTDRELTTATVNLEGLQLAILGRICTFGVCSTLREGKTKELISHKIAQKWSSYYGLFTESINTRIKKEKSHWKNKYSWHTFLKWLYCKIIGFAQCEYDLYFYMKRDCLRFSVKLFVEVFVMREKANYFCVKVFSEHV